MKRRDTTPSMRRRHLRHGKKRVSAKNNNTAPGGADASLLREVYIARDVDEPPPSGCLFVDVRRLPSGTSEERRRLIECYLIGASEGTIAVDRDRLRALELSAKALGLFVNQTMHIEATAKLSAKSLEDLLKKQPSRFALASTTMSEIKRAQRAALIPGAGNEKKEDLQ